MESIDIDTSHKILSFQESLMTIFSNLVHSKQKSSIWFPQFIYHKLKQVH